jgi:hypothetical protein
MDERVFIRGAMVQADLANVTRESYSSADDRFGCNIGRGRDLFLYATFTV